MPTISVIVPVYKVEPFLGRCVDSLLNQTYRDFELILVDDGSPDSCGEICDRYALQDSRVHVIHQQNGGLSAARNTGITHCLSESNSDWLAFVDSDDWVHPEYLQRLWETAEQTGCRISVCGFYRSSGEAIPEDPETVPVAMEAEEYYCSQIHEGVTAVAWNKLYHRSLFRKLRYPVGRLHEDEFTIYQAIFTAGEIGVTPVRLYAYYQNPDGIMRSQWNPKRMHMLDAFDQQIGFAQQNSHRKLLEKSTEALIYSICAQLPDAQKVFHKELRRRLRRALKLGRKLDCGLGYSRIQWAYELAYPCRLFWWLVSRVKRGDSHE